MTRILHLSDLHFGRAAPEVIEQVLREIHERAPDLVVISGDFTQSGTHDEFREARKFMRRIAPPCFTVPGNHDMPRLNFVERFVDPYARYRTYICPDTDPELTLDDLALVGINTARPVVPHWNWANGMVAKAQLARTEARFKAAPPGACRVFVCHHPLLAIHDAPLDTIVWRSRETLAMLARQRVDLVLSGHIHHASITKIGTEKPIIFLGAGTATSTRLRRQPNGYNLISVEKAAITLELYARNGTRFNLTETETVQRLSA